MKLNAPGAVREEAVPVHPIKLFRCLSGGKDTVVGRLREILNVKLAMKYCDQQKALENSQDRI